MFHFFSDVLEKFPCCLVTVANGPLSLELSMYPNNPPECYSYLPFTTVKYILFLEDKITRVFVLNTF